jgi:hypothetical protein
MPGVATLGTTFNLPNFVGPLHKTTAEDTILLAMSGGLTGGDEVYATDVPFSTVDNADPAQPDILEGADPVFAMRSREESGNVVQIFQYGLKHTYTNLASRRNLGVPGTPPSFPVLGDVQVDDELAFQTMLLLNRAARDVEYTFWRGAYQRPTSNASARKTRGFANLSGMTEVDKSTSLGTDVAITAASDDVTVTSHGLTAGDEVFFSASSTGAAPLEANKRYYVHTVTDANNFSLTETVGGSEIDITSDGAATGWDIDTPGVWEKADFDYLLQKMYEDSEAPMIEPVVFCSAYNKQFISDTYGIAPRDRNIGGLNIELIETDFGRLPVAVARHAPKNTLWVIDMAFVAPAYLRIPDKGHFFLEPVARTGAYEALQLYGEIGLQHGPAQFHGKLSGVTSMAP